MSTRLHNEHPALRAAWHPVARSEEITTDPAAVMLLGEPWVLVRMPELVAFVDQCPHRGAPLSAGAHVAAGLQCGYHGWCFDRDGACTRLPALASSDRIPARFSLRAPAGVIERYGIVWIAPDPPRAPFPEIDGFGDPMNHTVLLQPRRTSASASAATDNFLDVAHFPFLHTATFAVGDTEPVGDLQVIRSEWTIAFENRAPFLHADGVADSSLQVYMCTAPFGLQLRMTYSASEKIDTIVFFAQPERRDSTRLYKLLVCGGEVRDQHEIDEIAKFETVVLDEDLAM
ncbi:MAG: putative oxidoreductase, Rieske [2Fe-2S] region, partial [Actinomycetia bacterium]|nr:putative oxidoreductase, Rieske [2Fe-2S] region [Actinomycetes bacterium]